MGIMAKFGKFLRIFNMYSTDNLNVCKKEKHLNVRAKGFLDNLFLIFLNIIA